jgi:ketosteroid isomerase-like protein
MNVCRMVIASLVLLVACQARTDPSNEQEIQELARAIRKADHRGDREALRVAATKLNRFIEVKEAVPLALYWRGFAYWRRAVNGFNQKLDAALLEQDLLLGVRDFSQARALKPDFLEAEIGEAGCETGLIGATQADPEKLRRHLARARELLAEVKGKDPSNPRYLWLLGGALWNTPAAAGGSKTQATGAYLRGLTTIRSRAAEFPDWGEPELLISLGWSKLNDTQPDLEAAQTYVQAALYLAPEWHYAKEILLPQILEKRVKAAGSVNHGDSRREDGMIDKEKELKGIQRMRDKDVLASKSKDFATLATLFTEDAIAMPPGQDFQRRADRMLTMNKAADAMRNIEVLEYREQFEETEFVHDLQGTLMAIEWGKITGTSRDTTNPEQPPQASSYKVLRVLKRMPDGEWRIHRTIYNTASPEPPGAP